MKNAVEYARRVRRLFMKLKKEGGAVHPPDACDPTEQLLQGVFSNYCSEARAHAAVARLRAAMVDLNELRVTPTSELVDVIGDDFPMRHAAAEALTRALNAIYNRTHNVDLDFLKKYSKKRAESFVSGLDGVSLYTRALVNLRCFDGRSFPLDMQMFPFLKRSGCIPEDASLEQAQKFLGSLCRVSELETCFLLLKRYASAHAPRKSAGSRSSPPPGEPKASPQPAMSANSDLSGKAKSPTAPAGKTSRAARSKPKSSRPAKWSPAGGRAKSPGARLGRRR